MTSGPAITVLLIALVFAAPITLLAAVCAYGPLENRFLVWRRMRREAAWPIRIAQLTPYGWAEVVPGEGFAPAGRHRADATRLVALTVKAA